MQINISYDSSVDSAPAGFKTAVQAAVNYIDSLISTPIILTIDFGWGEENGKTISDKAVGQSNSTGYTYGYADVLNALTGVATSADDRAALGALPTADPTSGATFYVSAALGQALGLNGPARGGVDGWVGLNASDSYAFDPHDRAISGEFDAIGAFEHEISEVLGRTSGVGRTLTNGDAYSTVLDLFRYSSSGVLAPTAQQAGFSIDGKQPLMQFNDPSNGGDPGDWASGQAADSFGPAYKGYELPLSTTDQSLLDVLGYTLSPNQPFMIPAPADFNGDGRSDILWLNASAGQVSTWQSTVSGFSSNFATGIGAGWAAAGAADFTGDGKADLLWFDQASGQVSVWTATASGFYASYVAGAPAGWAPTATGDFNGDNKTDLLWFNAGTDQISVWTSHWSSAGVGFTPSYLASAPAGWSVAGTGDFNGDGQSDILWFNPDAHQVSVWTSTGSGFASSFFAGVAAGWTPVATGDFNGDGQTDILWFNASADQVSAWDSTGTGFASSFFAGVAAGWAPAAIGDFNGDGKTDILWFNSGAEQVSVWDSTGSGFASSYFAGVAAGWTVAAVEDFNGDGKSDILWFNPQTHQVSAWESTGSGFQSVLTQSVSAGWTPFDPNHLGLHLA